MIAIRNNATANAFFKNAWAFFCSSSSPRNDTGGRQPGLDLLDLVVSQNAGQHIGLHRHYPNGVDPPQQPGAWFCRTGNEVADRDQTFAGLDTDLVELVDGAVGDRIARDNVDFLVAVVGTVFGHLHAVGDEFDGVADQRHIGAELGRLRPVDRQLPLDAGYRPAILNVLETAQIVGEFPYLGHFGRQQVGIA
jgi:hypothetical protein